MLWFLYFIVGYVRFHAIDESVQITTLLWRLPVTLFYKFRVFLRSAGIGKTIGMRLQAHVYAECVGILYKFAPIIFFFVLGGGISPDLSEVKILQRQRLFQGGSSVVVLCCLVFGIRVSVTFHLMCLHIMFSSVWVA